MADKKRVIAMQLTAARCRKNVLRMVAAGGHGHIGGAFSAMDVVTALYFDHMHVLPDAIKAPERDRFLLSAGHKCLAQYAALAEAGFFDKSVLDSYGALGSLIPGHPDMHKLPGVEANTGALGHGMSIAAGMAMAAKLQKRDYRVFAICGDGELPEGSNWEAAAAAREVASSTIWSCSWTTTGSRSAAMLSRSWTCARLPGNLRLLAGMCARSMETIWRRFSIRWMPFPMATASP